MCVLQFENFFMGCTERSQRFTSIRSNLISLFAVLRQLIAIEMSHTKTFFFDTILKIQLLYVIG